MPNSQNILENTLKSPRNCIWCGQQFYPQSWNQQSCLAPECDLLRRRRKALLHLMYPFPIVRYRFLEESKELEELGRRGENMLNRWNTFLDREKEYLRTIWKR